MKFVGFDCQLNGEYLPPSISKCIFEDILNLPYIEVLHSGMWSLEIQDKYTYNNFIEGTNVPHEGIVIKYHTGERSKVAKVINPDYHIYSEKNKVGDSH